MSIFDKVRAKAEEEAAERQGHRRDDDGLAGAR